MNLRCPTLLLFSSLAAFAEPLRFNRDIRPILADKCFACHGQDPKQRKGELRLDVAAEAMAERKGGRAIVPGKPDESTVMQRILTTDPDDVMPPPDSHRTLEPAEKEKLRQWIVEGAAYEQHWAFQPPVRVPLPAVKSAAWVQQPMDALVLAKLESLGIAPSPPAAPERWLRRVSLDLTGLVPAPPELDAFAADVKQRGEAAYADAADRLLASPRFGERMAQDWLDAARYADSHGFNNDTSREMWRWRDWVIAAFNRNQPYDRFLTEQIAGDLLPAASLEQRIATAYCRNHVINSEGGIIDEEYRVEYVVDRLRTLGMSVLGLTLECARCHDHKYDPLTMSDFYSLYAFFNQVPEYGEDGRSANASPLLISPTEEQSAKLRSMDDRLRTLQTARDTAQILTPDKAAWTLPQNRSAPLREHQEIQRPVDFDKAWSFTGWLRWEGGGGTVFSNQNFAVAESSTSHGGGVALRVTAEGALELRMAARWPAYSVQTFSDERLKQNAWHHVAVISDGTKRARGLRAFLDGVEITQVKQHDGLEAGGMNANPLRIGSEGAKQPAAWRGDLAELRFYDRALADSELFPWDGDDLAKLQTERQKFWRDLPTTMVMQELAVPRPTFELKRGQYDAPGEAVTPGVPESLLGAWPQGAPRNRLGLAQWLTGADHPLTARVAVNRFWQQLFGTGLVKTSEDFGVQGEYPPQLELLDWVARDFVESGWNVKALLRGTVLSAAYRQDSAITPALLERDPENRLLARGARFRLPAEQIRDQALHVSGLLSERVGGPSVFPPQPPDLYKGIVVAASYAGTTWTESTGDDRVRRSLYTYLKRTVPYPVLNVFDAPDREFCAVRRARTNTPLQALTLMNEPSMLEAARAFASRMMAEGGGSPAERLAWGFRAATSRAPRAEERVSLEQTYNKLLPGSTEADAMNVMAGLLLNLDETLTRN
jgi:hypothetical protein